MTMELIVGFLLGMGLYGSLALMIISLKEVVEEPIGAVMLVVIAVLGLGCVCFTTGKTLYELLGVEPTQIEQVEKTESKITPHIEDLPVSPRGDAYYKGF